MAALKIKILPRFIFVFRSLILPILQVVLYEIQRDFNFFVWGEKRPRLKIGLLQRSKFEGGIAAPNITLYYQAVLLDNWAQWWNPSVKQCWEIVQLDILQVLSEWALSVKFSSALDSRNNHIKILSRLWKKLQDLLPPGQSPLYGFRNLAFAL